MRRLMMGVLAVALATAAGAQVAVSDTSVAEPTAGVAGPIAVSPAWPPSEAMEADPATASVPVYVGGREVFRVRTGRDGLDPIARAEAIRRRLDAIVATEDVSAVEDSVHLVPTLAGVEVRIGRRFLWIVTPVDAGVGDVSEIGARIVGLPGTLAAAIAEGREKRKPLRLTISAGVALALTILAWLVLRLLLAGGRRWKAWLGRRVAGRLPALRVGGFEVVSQAQLAGATVALLGRAHLVVGAVLLYAYLTTVTMLFPWTQGWSWLLLHIALREAGSVVATLWSAVPSFAAIVIVFVVFRWLVALSDRFFDAVEAGSVVLGDLHPELALPTKRLARIFMWLTAIVVAYPYIPGTQSKAVQGLSLLVGLMVSLGSTGVVGNAISGLVITYSRSFRVGDRVRVGEHWGDVSELGFLATKIRSIRNEEITVPNGQVAAGAIVNYSRLAQTEGLILHTEVTIGYDVEWRKVRDLLTAAAGRVEGVEREPTPWVNQRSLNDYHVSYELNCVTRNAHAQLRLYNDLHAEIQDAFAQDGVEILSPAYHAIRDANAPVLPSQPGGPREEPGGFRVRTGA